MLMCWKVCLHVREQPLTSTIIVIMHPQQHQHHRSKTIIVTSVVIVTAPLDLDLLPPIVIVGVREVQLSQ